MRAAHDVSSPGMHAPDGGALPAAAAPSGHEVQAACEEHFQVQARASPLLRAAHDAASTELRAAHDASTLLRTAHDGAVRQAREVVLIPGNNGSPGLKRFSKVITD